MAEFTRPKYVVDVFTRLPNGQVRKDTMVWDTKNAGRASDTNLEKWVLAYGKSMESGGVNAHISEACGYIPYPNRAVIRHNYSGGLAVFIWNAPPFMVW